MSPSLRTIVLATMISACLVQPAPAWAGKLVNSDGFENYSLSKWRKVGNSTSTVVNSQTKKGNYAAKTEIRKDKDKYPERTELRLRGNNHAFKREYWVGVNIFVPNDWQNDEKAVTVTQFHGVSDKHLGEKSLNAPLALRIAGNEWRLINRWDSKSVSTNSKLQSVSRRLGSIKKGQWTSWVFRVEWSYKSDGFLEIFKDGKSVFKRNGPNTYNNKVGNYLKIGLYKPSWRKNYKWKGSKGSAKVHTLYFDEIKVAEGSNSLSLVSP